MAIDNASEWDVCDICGHRHPPVEPGLYMVGDDVDIVPILMAHMKASQKPSLLIDTLDAENKSDGSFRG
jgi:hypothetical protein